MEEITKGNMHAFCNLYIKHKYIYPSNSVKEKSTFHALHVLQMISATMLYLSE